LNIQFKPVKNNLKACKIYIGNTEDSKSFKIEFNTDIFSFEIYRLNRYLKRAFRGTLSESDKTSSIGSVILNYYFISIFVVFGVTV
jgi:hypothetical protein